MTGRKILVVEDHPITGMNEMAILRELGYDVIGIAFSGEDAISRADEDKPDVVLMDIKLIGEMDGREAARKIKEQFCIPVVFVTGLGDKEASKSAVPPEGYGYVVKPFTKAELSAAIENVLPRS